MQMSSDSSVHASYFVWHDFFHLREALPSHSSAYSDYYQRKSNMNDDDKNNATQYALKIMEIEGVACSTVDDGHVLMFKREFLENTLAKYPDSKEIFIFVQRPDFKKAN